MFVRLKGRVKHDTKDLDVRLNIGVQLAKAVGNQCYGVRKVDKEDLSFALISHLSIVIPRRTSAVC